MIEVVGGIHEFGVGKSAKKCNDGKAVKQANHNQYGAYDNNAIQKVRARFAEYPYPLKAVKFKMKLRFNIQFLYPIAANKANAAIRHYCSKKYAKRDQRCNINCPMRVVI